MLSALEEVGAWVEAARAKDNSLIFEYTERDGTLEQVFWTTGAQLELLRLHGDLLLLDTMNDIVEFVDLSVSLTLTHIEGRS
jgi:hypothetical protein